MVQYLQDKQGLPYHDDLYNCFMDEWGDVESFENELFAVSIPYPIVAIQNEKMIAGLAFTRYPSPIDGRMAPWINALLVLPEWRHQGIAGALIERAMAAVTTMNITSLCVYTNVPDLYLKKGWQLMYLEDGQSVMQVDLTLA